jgi:aryl-alcohol dehydrogenase-like predicted oxidoreductase
MQYVRLGSTGLQVSRLCLGMMSYGTPAWRPWVLDESASRPIVRRAWDRGITFFDTADMYSRGASEEVTGRLLRELGPRDRYVVATKVFYPIAEGPNTGGLSRGHVLDAIDASLKRLGMDYVDLYQIHRWDPATPIDETLRALEDIVRAGKARYIGASSMHAWQFATALGRADLHGWSRFVTMQNHYNLIYREEEREMIPLCRAEGIGTLPWSPLARGFLAGNRTRTGFGDTSRARTDTIAQGYYYTELDFEIAEAVERIARARGVSAAQVALAWVLSRPTVAAPIVGATKLAQLDEAVAAVELSLSSEEQAAVEAPYRPRAVLGHE